MMEEDIAPETAEDDLGPVKDIVRTITKTAKAFNVYPKDNPIYHKFVTELVEKFDAYFESSDELALDVEQNALRCRGTEVFKNDDRTDNIALLLFADGIRQLNFYKGLTSCEITDFIDILRAAPRAEMNDEDDIVTLLWEKNIRNMGYTAAEDTVDDDLVLDETFFADAQAEVPLGDQQASVDATGAPGFVPPDDLPAPFAAEPLTEAETAALRDEIGTLDEEHLLAAIDTLFFELLSSENCGDCFSEIIQNLGRIIDIRMKKKDIAGTIGILEGLRDLRAKYPSPGEIETISAATRRAGYPENLQTLFEGSDDNGEIRKYLLLLDGSAIPGMVQTLGEARDRKQRRLLCEVLAVLGRDNIDALAESADDPKWYLVRNLALIFGMTKEAASVKHLAKMLKHEDLRVRREALRALDAIPSDETRHLFLSALEDPDFSVRAAALRALRRFRDPELFETLKKGAGREELKKRPLEEKRMILETLSELGGEDAFPLLSDLFQKKGILEKDEITELRAAAAYGLGLLGSPGAVALLEKETRSRKNVLKNACIEALRLAQRDGNNRR
jgi:hypothetical protein